MLAFETVLTNWRSATRRQGIMRHNSQITRSGKVGWIILWLIGIPIPVLLFLYLIRGCT